MSTRKTLETDQILHERSGLKPVEGVSPLPIWSTFVVRLQCQGGNEMRVRTSVARQTVPYSGIDLAKEVCLDSPKGWVKFLLGHLTPGMGAIIGFLMLSHQSEEFLIYPRNQAKLIFRRQMYFVFIRAGQSWTGAKRGQVADGNSVSRSFLFLFQPSTLQFVNVSLKIHCSGLQIILQRQCYERTDLQGSIKDLCCTRLCSKCQAFTTSFTLKTTLLPPSRYRAFSLPHKGPS